MDLKVLEDGGWEKYVSWALIDLFEERWVLLAVHL